MTKNKHILKTFYVKHFQAFKRSAFSFSKNNNTKKIPRVAYDMHLSIRSKSKEVFWFQLVCRRTLTVVCELQKLLESMAELRRTQRNHHLCNTWTLLQEKGNKKSNTGEPKLRMDLILSQGSFLLLCCCPERVQIYFSHIWSKLKVLFKRWDDTCALMKADVLNKM